MESSNETMVSVFERDGKKRYYLINLSTTEKNETTAAFGKGRYVAVTDGGKIDFENKITINLDEGQGIYIIRK